MDILSLVIGTLFFALGIKLFTYGDLVISYIILGASVNLIFKDMITEFILNISDKHEWVDTLAPLLLTFLWPVTFALALKHKTKQ